MKSDFTVQCPKCNHLHDFGEGDNWMDELIDDSDTTIVDCHNCDSPMEITTHAVYTLSVESIEE